MAFERFTDRARKVVSLASEEANRMGSDSVDTVHLLLGMLREGKGVAGKVLAMHGIDIDGVLEANNSLGGESDVTMPDLESSCVAEATWLGHNYVGTEHLLLGVCCLLECNAVLLLMRMDTSPNEQCKHIIEVVGHGCDWRRWLTDHPDMLACEATVIPETVVKDVNGQPTVFRRCSACSVLVSEYAPRCNMCGAGLIVHRCLLCGSDLSGLAEFSDPCPKCGK